MRAAEIKPENVILPGQIGPRAVNVLLWAQRTVAARNGAYRYLEIGSYRGRSLFPHVICDECAHALSIDLRPAVTADERGPYAGYDRITAENMVALIRRHAPPEVDVDAKLRTETANSDCLRALPRPLPRLERYDLAFIDGEHTNAAAFRDALNALEVLADDAILMFDDTAIVLDAVQNALSLLEVRGAPHRVHYTHSGVTLILLGAYREAAHPPKRFVVGLGRVRKRRREILKRALLAEG